MLVRVTQSPDWPVRAGDLIEHVRDDSDAGLTLMVAYVAAASEHVQEITRRAVCEQTFDLFLDGFPSGPIDLPLPPLQSVVSVTYKDADGAQQTWAAADYVVDTASGQLSPAVGKSYPATQAVPNAVTVRFIAGYPRSNDKATTPEPIRAAILLLAADLYENREGQSSTALHDNRTVERLLWPWRVF